MAAGFTFAHPVSKPLFSFGKPIPNGAYVFTVTGGQSPAVVYRDAYLKVPFSATAQTGFTADSGVTADSFLTADAGSAPGGGCTVYADAAGNFPPIYLDPTVAYCVQLYTGNGALIYTVDPYIVPIPSLGNGPIQVNPTTGEVAINAPNAGGSGFTLTVVPKGGLSIGLVSQGPNSGNNQQPQLQFLNLLTTGTSTANFAPTNKPGTGNTSIHEWIPILGDGNAVYYMPVFL